MYTANKVATNALALFIRSLVMVGLALFSTRWALAALGETDFGLYGVIASSILLVTFISSGMSAGVGRFYAFAVGQSQNMSQKDGHKKLKYWFNTALIIHVLLAVALVAIAYPLGKHAIHNWLTIPGPRLTACHIVMILVLGNTAMNIVSVPFTACFTANQDLVELSIYDLITSLITCGGTYAILHIDSDRLVTYGILMAGTGFLCRTAQIARCFYKYPYCRVSRSHMVSKPYIKELFTYVGWKMLGMGCVIFRIQGTPVIVNLFLGPSMNAAYNVANRVNVQAENLSAAMAVSFQPMITGLEGKGSREAMLSAALRASKFGGLLVLTIALPLSIEMDSILRLWLVKPPEHTALICKYIILSLVIDKMTSGQMMAVNAHGRMKTYEMVQGGILISTLPLLAWLLNMQYGANGVGLSLLISMAMYCAGRVAFAKKITSMPYRPWLRRVLIPIITIIATCSLMNWALTHLPENIYRIAATCSCNLTVISVLAWFIAMDEEEKKYTALVVSKMRSKALNSLRHS